MTRHYSTLKAFGRVGVSLFAISTLRFSFIVESLCFAPQPSSKMAMNIGKKPTKEMDSSLLTKESTKGTQNSQRNTPAAKHHDNIIDEFENKGFFNPDEQFSDIVLKSGYGGRTIVHALVERIESELYEQAEAEGKESVKTQDMKSRKQTLLELLVIKYPKLLTKKDQHDKSVLEQAAKKCLRVLSWIIDLSLDEETIKALKEPCKKSSADGSRAYAISLNSSLTRSFAEMFEDDHVCAHDRLRDPQTLKQFLQQDSEFKESLREALKPKDLNQESCLHDAVRSFESHPLPKFFERLISLAEKTYCEPMAPINKRRYTQLLSCLHSFQLRRAMKAYLLSSKKSSIRLSRSVQR